MRISYCTFRLLFKHPFGTAHGLRDGTDSVFIRTEEDGHAGYGEVTLPPYLKETIAETIARIEGIAARGFLHAGQLLSQLDALPELQAAHACRAGLSTALIDLISKKGQWPVHKLLDISGKDLPLTLMTLGYSGVELVESKLADLPVSGGLKMKVGDTEGMARVERVLRLDARPILLDGNEGLHSVDDAVALAQMIGLDRLVGFEQPFTAGADELHRQLAECTGAVVFADESVQNLADLSTKYASFSGVNLKLMKCGGLDVAKAMADKAHQLGLKVMLGSMSESSLGCTAMAQLAGESDVVDLDGPWLLKNDPFTGIGLADGRLVIPAGPGIGATLQADLVFTPFGA